MSSWTTLTMKVGIFLIDKLVLDCCVRPRNTSTNPWRNTVFPLTTVATPENLRLFLVWPIQFLGVLPLFLVVASLLFLVWLLLLLVVRSLFLVVLLLRSCNPTDSHTYSAPQSHTHNVILSQPNTINSSEKKRITVKTFPQSESEKKWKTSEKKWKKWKMKCAASGFALFLRR